MRSRREVLAGSVLAGLSLALPRLARAAEPSLVGRLECVRVSRGRVRVRAWVTADQDLHVAASEPVAVTLLRVDGVEQPIQWQPRDAEIEDVQEVWMTRAGPRRRTEPLASGVSAGSWWFDVRAKPDAQIHVDAELQLESYGLPVSISGVAPGRAEV